MLGVRGKVILFLVLMAMFSVPPPALAGPGLAPVAPPTPSGLHAAYNNTTRALTFTWTMPAGTNGSVVDYLVYKNGIQVDDPKNQSYTTADFASFSLFWVQAHNENGTSQASPPVGVIACGTTHFDPSACSPNSAAQLASWRNYPQSSAVMLNQPLCNVADINLFPFGYTVYPDCIAAIIRTFAPGGHDHIFCYTLLRYGGCIW